MYPARQYKRVVVIIDNAPWHRGRVVDEALREQRQLELYRLPSYSPSLNVIERFWKTLRRHSTHNRLFDTLAELKRAVRDGLRYFQTVRRKVLSLIQNCYHAPLNQTPPPGS
jgi:transposase